MRKNLLAFVIILLSVFTFGQNFYGLKKDVKNIIKDKNATVAVSVLDFESGKSFNINGNKKLPMLSVFKFHIALKVLNEVDQGKFSLDQKILIKKSDLLENTWSPIREKYPEGNIEIPLSELLKYAVAQSDNNGCDILLRLLGGPSIVQKFMNENGIEDVNIIYNEEKMHEGYEFHYGNWTTTNSANFLLKKFHDKKLISKGSTDFLMNTLLGTTTGATKLVAQLPKGIPVAHKTGSSGKNEKGLTIAENDIGIVTLPNGKKYAISVFVSNSMETEKTNTKMIADISRLVFNFNNKK
ncbi:class A beta-lactamase, subclass A2 [Chryseobacterium sp. MP_3.2]|uniref:class A beta-lactamase, subclass A2 n=1 Tax=Chryseobacterium sp. MP_3.2 TaxID=3071712 RepID=UPI002E0C74D5|nr:beta-lactamase class A [Chryseobacterium sp. MP_3.2]